jgi:hypothetical protein
MRLLPIILLFISPSLLAYPIAKYIGIGTGYTWTQSTFNEKVSTFGDPETPSYGEVSNGSLPFSFYGGFRFHPNYGLELGYVNYGTIEFNKTLTTRNASDDSQILKISDRQAEISSSGFLISHVFYYQPLSAFTLQAKLGVLFGDTQYSDIEKLTTFSQDTGELTTYGVNSNTDAFAKFQMAVGALYQYDQDWLIRLQLNQLEFENSDEKENFTQWFTQLSFEYQL